MKNPRRKPRIQAFCLAAAFLLSLAACKEAEPPAESVPSVSSEPSKPAASASNESETFFGTGEYGMVESRVAANNPDDLLEMVRETEQDLPEEFFWIDEEAVVELIQATFPMWTFGECREGLVTFSRYLEEDVADEDLPLLYGISEEELRLGLMTRWPWADWRELMLHFTLTVTLRPQEEPPALPEWNPPEPEEGSPISGIEITPRWRGSTATPAPVPEGYVPEPLEDYQPPQWEPAEGHPGMEMAVVESLPNGNILSARVRWQEEGFWFLAEVPGHILDSFLENGPSLWVKTSADPSVPLSSPVPTVAPMPEPEDGLTADPEDYRSSNSERGESQFSSVMAYSWNGALLREEVKGFGVVWWFNDAPVTEMYGQKVFADGVCHNGVCSFMFQDPREPEALAPLYALTGEELQWSWMDPWPWKNWCSLTREWYFYVTLQPMTGEGIGLWATPAGGAYETYEDDLQDTISKSKRFSDEESEYDLMEMYRAGQYGPKNAQPASQYQPPVFRPVEGLAGVEMAVVARTPSDQPLQVRFQWKTEDGYGCWAVVPGWAVDRFYQYFDQWFIRVDTGEPSQHEGAAP